MVRVREVRSGAIETNTGQEDFIRALEPVDEFLPKTDLYSIRDRAIGALVGLAVGDAVGTTLEFSSRDDQAPRLTDMVGGGPFSLEPGQWTDDTSMALALADSLLVSGGFDPADLMKRFVRWWRHGDYSSNGLCFDIGSTTREALDRFLRTGNPIAGSTSPDKAGNGSLMRLAPVAMRYWTDENMRRQVAAGQSATTHGVPEAIDACVAFTDILADAIAGKPRSEVLRSRRGPYPGRIGEIAGGAWREKSRDRVRASGYVAHSFEAALWCVGRTSNFRDAILLAANLREDADTTAAITGQLAGAIYGRSGIDPEWLCKVHAEQNISKVAEDLFEQATVVRQARAANSLTPPPGEWRQQ
jgi:ADP-ribosyl-[dinitrogen reductase] hydrolase